MSEFHANPMPRLVYAWEGQVEKLQAELDRLRAEVHEAHAACDAQVRECNRLRAELAKHQWQPIDTAPRDGDATILIGCFGKEWHGDQFVVFYDDRPDRLMNPWQTPDGIAYHRDAPTHWMPLPDPPKETE